CRPAAAPACGATPGKTPRRRRWHGRRPLASRRSLRRATRCSPPDSHRGRAGATSTPPTRHRCSSAPPESRQSRLHHVFVHVRAAVAVELPGVADLTDQIHVQVGDEELLLFIRRLRDDLAARVREVARAGVLVRSELLLLPPPA